MKKTVLGILSVGIVLCLTSFLFTGCATVFEQYKAAFDKTNALSEYDASVEATVSISADGSSTTIPLKMAMKAKDLNGGSPVIWAETQTSMLGFSTKSTMYYADGWGYMDMLDSKIKTQLSLEDFYEQAGVEPEQMIEFPEEVFKDIKFEKKGDDKILNVKCSGSIIKEQLLKSLDGAEDLLGEDANVEDMTFSDVEARFVLNKDGYISEYKIKFELTLPAASLGSDADMVMGMDMTIKYNKPGSGVTIEAPKDLDSYEEFDLNEEGFEDDYDYSDGEFDFDLDF